MKSTYLEINIEKRVGKKVLLLVRNLQILKEIRRKIYLCFN